MFEGGFFLEFPLLVQLDDFYIICGFGQEGGHSHPERVVRIVRERHRKDVPRRLVRDHLVFRRAPVRLHLIRFRHL